MMNYDEFSKKSKTEKIIYLEDFIKNEEYKYISPKYTRRLFEDIIDNEPNTYLKRVTIDNIGHLVSYNIITKTDATSLLLSVDVDEDPYLIILVLKYLFIYNNNNPDVIERITEYINSNNPEIASEAYYRIALINFLSMKLTDLNLLNYVKHLEKIKGEFERSSDIMENRVDAEYYVELLGFLVEVLKQDDYNINIKFTNMTNKLWNLKLNGAEVGPKIEIYKSVLNMKEIYSKLSKLSNWTNFTDELNRIYKYHQLIEFEKLNYLTSKEEITYVNDIRHNILVNILESLYIGTLYEEEKRIIISINEMENLDDDEERYFDGLQEMIKTSKRKDKKKEGISNVLLLHAIDCIPKSQKKRFMIEIEEWISSGKDITNVEIINLIKKYNESENNGFRTGFKKGEEMYDDVLKDLNQFSENYCQENFGMFMILCEMLINYLIRTIRDAKIFEMYFEEKSGGKGQKILEEDFQNSLYQILKGSRYAELFNYEQGNFADKGRIDIVFNRNQFVIPIEVKRTFINLSKDTIRENFLGQIFSYTKAYDGIGILIILDLTEKDNSDNDVKDYLYVDKLKKQHQLGDDNSNYVLVMIVPGNKKIPSSRSKYR